MPNKVQNAPPDTPKNGGPGKRPTVGSPSPGGVSREILSFKSRFRTSRKGSILSAQALSPDELYECGLRQSRVGTPYFIDNELNDDYTKLLQKTAPSECETNSTSSSMADSKIKISQTAQNSDSKRKSFSGSGININENANLTQTISEELVSSSGIKMPNKNDRMKRGQSEGYDSTLYGSDVFEGIQKEIKIKTKRRKMKGFLGFLDYLIHLIPIKSPVSKVRQVWDASSIVVIMFSVYTAMFEQAFQPTVTLASENDIIFLLDKASETFFWVDVIFNFFTSDFDSEGDLVSDRTIICRNYLGTWFSIDVISNLPLGGGLSLLKGLRLFRFPRILLRWAYLGYSTKALNLFKLIITITTSGHLVACAFYMVARVEEHGELNWTFYDGLYSHTPEYEACVFEFGAEAVVEGTSCDGVIRLQQNFGKGYHYISSLYFAYATLTTVGYGDIKAKTEGERAVALVALVIGSAVFAGIVGTMNQLMETMDENEEKKLKKIKQIQQFIKSHHFPEASRVRIREFYNMQFQYDKKELGMLAELPPALKNDCMHHIYHEQLKKIPFLKTASSIVQNAFISNVEPLICCAKDYILIEGQLQDRLYLITHGVADLINNKGMVCRSYAMGSFFGEKCAFFSGYLSKVSFRAKTDVELLTIDRAVLLNLLNTYDQFALMFIDACKKREVQKIQKADGGTKFTSFKKNSEIMFRPCTPPSGVNDWKKNDALENKWDFQKVFCEKDESMAGIIKELSNLLGGQIKELKEELQMVKMELRAANNPPPK